MGLKAEGNFPYTLNSVLMTQSRPKQEIEIRHCATLSEYDECVGVEHATWGEEISIPSAIFVVAHHTGGQVIGAFDGSSGSRMVGFTVALVGVRAGKPFLHSHMTAVLPEFRNRGVGRRLKLFQRQDALRRGLSWIEWTFDPLDLKNAHFNFVRLGAVARRYIPNCYGVTPSPLHAGLPTDRLVAEWVLDSDRVKAILADNPIPLRNPSARVGIPANIAEIRERDQTAAARVQDQTREEFRKWFGKGYVATGVERRGDTVEYVLEREGAIAGLSFPRMNED